MFFPEGRIRVHLYGEPCDMRKSFDGLQDCGRLQSAVMVALVLGLLLARTMATPSSR